MQSRILLIIHLKRKNTSLYKDVGHQMRNGIRNGNGELCKGSTGAVFLKCLGHITRQFFLGILDDSRNKLIIFGTCHIITSFLPATIIARREVRDNKVVRRWCYSQNTLRTR